MLLVVSSTRINAGESRPLMRDFIGINGHTVQFKPELYQSVCRVVRDYHPVEWDLGTNTAVQPPFPFAKNHVDWGKVYGSWKEKGWRIDVCLMFESVNRTNWTNVEADARAYGYAFAREFGPTGNASWWSRSKSAMNRGDGRMRITPLYLKRWQRAFEPAIPA